jgi:hypothetical protein
MHRETTSEPVCFVRSGRLFLSLEGIRMSSTWPKHRFLTYKSRDEVWQDQ